MQTTGHQRILPMTVNYMEVFVQHVFHNQLPMLVANQLQQPSWLLELVGEYMPLQSDRRLPWGHSPVFKLMCLKPYFCFFPITRHPCGWSITTLMLGIIIDFTRDDKA